MATVTPQTATNGTDFTKGGGGSCDTGRNVDYFMRSLPTDVRIAPGESSASTTVTFHICSDDLDEPNETIPYTATAPGATFTEAVLTIGDPETITLSVSPDTIAEDAGATETTVTATMSAARATDTVVDLTLGGTALDPADYTATGLASITIPANSTSGTATLTITPINDAVQEVDETITVSGTSGARPVTSADIILTNVTQPAPVISFETAPESVDEGQTATYVVKLEGRRTTNVTVRFTTGAAGDLADAGETGLHGGGRHHHLHPHRDTTKTVTVSTLPDQRFEVSEDFTVTLLERPGRRRADAPRYGKAPGPPPSPTPPGDDDAYPESYTLTATPASVGEGDGATEIRFTATLDDEGGFPYPVDVIVYVEGKAGEKGTADLTGGLHRRRQPRGVPDLLHRPPRGQRLRDPDADAGGRQRGGRGGNGRLHQRGRRRPDNLRHANRHPHGQRICYEHNVERQPVGPARGQLGPSRRRHGHGRRWTATRRCRSRSR